MEWHACMIYYIIVSHYNGFIETETAQIVLKDHGRIRGTFRYNSEFIHSTIRKSQLFAETPTIF